MASIAEPLVTAQTISPYIAFRDAAAALDFYKRAFGAVETVRLAEPGGKVGHAEMRIGNAVIMLSDEYPDYGALSAQSIGGSPVRIQLYVEDVDAFTQRAVAAGARLVRPITDEFYGDRVGRLEDPFGYTWFVSTKKEQITAREVERRYDELMKGAPQAVGTAGREGFRTVTPYLVSKNVPALIDFIIKTFNAKETLRTGPGSQGGMHCEVRLGDCMFMVGGGGPGFDFGGDLKPGAFHVYVPDCDAAHKRALDAGAASIDEPVDRFYGERSSTVKDAAGNLWYIATYKGPNYKWEGAPDVQPCLHPLRAEPVMNFLKRAFGAEESGRHATPDGVIHHATMKLGSSYLELGDAHGPYQPMASMFYLYVPNVDELYRRALAAGAKSISEPADQPYGDRVGSVIDPFGNQWYIGTHMAKHA